MGFRHLRDPGVMDAQLDISRRRVVLRSHLLHERQRIGRYLLPRGMRKGNVTHLGLFSDLGGLFGLERRNPVQEDIHDETDPANVVRDFVH